MHEKHTSLVTGKIDLTHPDNSLLECRQKYCVFDQLNSMACYGNTLFVWRYITLLMTKYLHNENNPTYFLWIIETEVTFTELIFW